jgi:hypothetical protein
MFSMLGLDESQLSTEEVVLRRIEGSEAEIR